MGENKGRFPAPYVNATNEDDPIMKRVPVDTMNIGASRAGLPKGGRTNEVSINHVGDAVKSGR